MIPQIREINFPSYATLHQATVSLAEMGERTISTQVKIDGDIVPDFEGWELEFKGERFVLPYRDPQATKDNTTRNSLVDLVFQSWAIQQLKRYFFMSLSEVRTGVAIPDQYIASVTLPLEQFVELFNSVLKYYFGDRIRMDLFGMGTGIYSTNPVAVEINYTYIWDVLTKFHELFDIRWRFEYDATADTYVIKAGYPAAAIDDHDFEYGYKGGLLKFERQVQDETINNILLGRGGEKNVPYRYFKRVDEQNPSWAQDPDALYELKDIYFDRIRDINFRWYVRGWMQNANRDQTWENAGYTYPQYTEQDCPADSLFAFRRGKTDAKFNPVEFVKDDESIAKYGERWGALDNNDEIFPTIQGIERPAGNRVDEIVDVSEIVTDDIDEAAKAAVTENSIGGTKTITRTVGPNASNTDGLRSNEFYIPEGKIGNIESDWLLPAPALLVLDTNPGAVTVENVQTGEIVPAARIPSGHYIVRVTLTVRNDSTQSSIQGTYGLNSLKVVISDENADAWKPTFDIWVKNIWATTQGASESDQAYAERVWAPILGDRTGGEAKVVFSDGFMAVSQDYEFPIVSYPVPDRTKSINGVPSEWKITLRKSDAEFDATGLYIPNSKTGGKPTAGDHFFFIGIDMPNQYVVWAEEEVNKAKVAKLEETKEINPVWVINLDKVRVHTLEDEDYGVLLADRLSAGCMVRTLDRRFTRGQALTLYVQSITYTWNEGDQVPNIEVVLSDKVLAVSNPIGKLSNEMQIVRSTYAKTADIEAVVRRVASPLFLKKTGESDTSISPTVFASKISSRNFRQGDIGGAGWGHYEDGDGDSVLELDKLVIRKELRVNSLVANQITYVGGKQVLSAASINCTQVLDDGDYYYCYFDQKQGSVANLFEVGDFAMGQEFDSENLELRYYRFRVDEVGVDYIKLSKSVKDGAGIPQEGDVIVQYGNDTNSARQYVIIRDVIGGGYERMLSGLSTVTADGDEYYFAGRQSGQGPRWFVGDAAGEYAEWVNGRLNIKGTLIIRNADGSYQAMTDYMESVQRQIDGQIQSWSSGQSQTQQTEPYPQVVDDVVDPTTANFPASSWAMDTDREQHFGDIYVDDSTGQGYRYTKRVKNGVTEYYWTRITDEEVAEAMRLAQLANTRVDGLEYLKEATNNGTTLVDGGLILSNLMALGQTVNQQFQINAGINGVMNAGRTRLGGGTAAWFGGDISDKDDLDQGVTAYAKSLFRFDGSGYLAGGNIHWDSAGYGGIPGITWNGSDIIIGGNVKLASLTGDSVTELVTLVRALSNMFIDEEYTDGGQTKHRIKVNPSFTGFYADGFISAGGVGSSQGGGGDVDLDRVWESLTNNIDFPNTKINTAHIPDVASIYGYLKAITGAMVTAALGYTPFNNASFTQTNIKSTLGIYDWALASTKPGYSVSEISGLQVALNAKQDTISDLSTIRSNAANGATAYGWGNHANAGYLTSVDGTTISSALQSLQSQIDSIATRNCFDELTATVAFADVLSASAIHVESLSLDGSDLAGSLSALGSRATSLESRATSLESRATSLESRATSLEGKFTGDSANSALRLTTVSKTAWGQTYWTSGGVPDSISGNMSSVGSISMNGSISGATSITASGLIKTTNYVQATRFYLTDSIYFVADSNGVKLEGAGFYTDFFVTAGGIGSGSGGGGIDLPRVWESLTNNTDFPDTEINPAHIPDMAATYGYLKSITSSMVVSALGYTPFSSANFTKANIQSTLGISAWALDASKPSYSVSEITGLQSALDEKQLVISDLATIRANAEHGETAYNSLSTVSAVLQSLQSQIDSVASRDCFDELTASVFHSDMVAVSDLYAGTISLNGADLATSLSGLSTAIANEATARANAIAAEVAARNTAIANAVNALDSATEAVSSGYFLTSVTITDGKITGRAQANSISGNAATATRLADNNSHYLWGVSYWESGVPKDVTAAPNLYIARTKVRASADNDTLLGVTAISNASSSGSTGDETRIEWDATNHAWHFYGGIYADTFVVAGGVGSSGGGSGIDLGRVWESLTNNTDFPNVEINPAHIPGIAWGKITSGKPTTLAGYGITDARFGTAGADYVPITLGTATKNVLTSHQSLSAYATKDYVGHQGFITKAVNDLTNYYTKTQTYTRTEVNDLIGSIDQFHYEIAASTGAVTDPQSNVLYLIGPTGSGSDKYEEYVYTTQWTKIGDTSIDLTPYLTKTLAAQTYQPIISDLATIRSNAEKGSTAYSDLTTVSAILQSLQSQVDSVASRDTFDELTATVFYSDMAAVSDLYVGAVSLNGVDLAGSLSSLASRATSLESRATALEGRATSLEGRATTLESYFTNGVAKSALRLSGTSAYSIWGVEYWSSGVPKSVTGRPGLYIGTTQVQTTAASQDLNGIAAINASGLATIAGGIKLTTTKKIYFGDTDHYLELDSNGFHFSHGVYSEGFVTAGGIGSGGSGGGIDIDRMWQSLTNNPADSGYENTKIAIAHIPDMAATYGYLKGNQTITLTGVVTGSGTTSIATSIADGALSIAKVSGLQAALDSKTGNTGTVTSVGLSVPTGLSVSGSPITTSGTLAITFASGYSIPTTAQQSAWSGKQDAISDLATIRSNAANGATAYSWGNHASAGYLTSGNGTTISRALQSLQSQIDSVAARDMFDELSATVLNADTLTATSAYIGTVNGSLSGNATTASYLVSASYGIGGGLNPIYFSGGRPVASTSTAGSASVPVYLNGGTLTAITPSSLFSALSSSAGTNLSMTIAGQTKTATIYATYDSASENISDKFGIVSTALQSLQSQVDSVASRDRFDELNATVLFTDMISVGADALVGGTLKVSGAATLSSTLAVTGNTTLSGSLIIGNSSSRKNLSVYGDSFLYGMTYIGKDTPAAPCFVLDADSQAGLKIGPDIAAANHYMHLSPGGVLTVTDGIVCNGNISLTGDHFIDFNSGTGLPLSRLYFNTDNNETFFESPLPIRFESGVISDSYITAGAAQSSSDRSMKSNIEDFKNTMGILSAIKPREWDWNETSAIKGHCSGFIAQEIENIMPYAVGKGSDGRLALNYSTFHALEVSALQIHENRISVLEKENALLKAEIESLKASRKPGN